MSAQIPGDTQRGLAGELKQAAARLGRAGVASPQSDATHLLAHVLGVDPGEVHRRCVLGRTLPARVAPAWDALIQRRAAREPLQHLTGQMNFAGITLQVGPGVFTPRPETEVIIEKALAAAPSPTRIVPAQGPPPQLEVVDLCTGSGALVLALGGGLMAAGWGPEELILRAVELDPVAASYARDNARRLNLEVDLRVEDARTALQDRSGHVDLVLCNPPYVPATAVPADPEVRDFDPPEALFGGGVDGLELPVALAARAAVLLRPGGRLFMEHDETQGETLPAALAPSTWRRVVDHADLTGRPRVLEAVRSSPQRSESGPRLSHYPPIIGQ